MAEITTQPRPSQFAVDTGSLTPTQSSYIEFLKTRPSAQKAYSEASQELGIPQQSQIVSGLGRSILDLEGKIKQVEPNINAVTGGFLVNEAARQRKVNVDTIPLRDQYLESIRRQQGASETLTGLNNLLSQRLQYSGQDTTSADNVFQQLLKFQTENAALSAKNKLDSGYDPNKLLQGFETTPTPAIPTDPTPTSVLDETAKNDAYSSEFSSTPNNVAPSVQQVSTAPSKVAGITQGVGSIFNRLGNIYGQPTKGVDKNSLLYKLLGRKG